MDQKFLDWVPKEAVQEFAALARACIIERMLPCLAKETEICLLPKNEYDERPIGVMSTLCRIVSRCFK